MKCVFCGNEVGNTIHRVKERIINNGDEFTYLECGKCHSWMLADEISDLAAYYPKSYNPYESATRKKQGIISRIYRYFMIRMIFSMPYSFFKHIIGVRGVEYLVKRLCGIKIKTNSAILDVGCALGGWLDQLYDAGYKNITGVDLFIPEEKMLGKKWKFVRGDIYKISGQYDLITLNHSMEHMENPRRVLERVSQLLNVGGKCMISLPLVGGLAHIMYGECYCQLDAPRHLVLPTKEMMKEMIEDAGLNLEYVNFDDSGHVFSLSRGFKETDESHANLIKARPSSEDVLMAKKANREGKADQAIFIMKKLA